MGTEIHPAVVTIVDGENAGKSAETDVGGFYEIAGLRSETFTVSVSAQGFVGTSQRVDFGVERMANFQLLPVAEQLRYVLTGDIRGTDCTCSDGVAQRPCRIVTFPVHNAGTIEARLDWTPSATSDLDLSLFKTGVREPLARSAVEGRDNEVVRAEVEGRATYELHITYRDGSTAATYTLTLDTPN